MPPAMEPLEVEGREVTASVVSTPRHRGLVATCAAGLLIAGTYTYSNHTAAAPGGATNLINTESRGTFQPLPWDESHASAREMLTRMTRAEKETLVNSHGYSSDYHGGYDPYKYWYLGNIAAIPRLGIPSLNLHDAADGYRTNIAEVTGTVTGWPSLLSFAATWDQGLVRRFGNALGEEFTAKGANVLLGPSVEVHRVAKNGRNFEYLSGEDPYLGAKLTKEYVQGVQSNGIMAVVKHFAFNHQETHRGSDASAPWSSSNVDEKTAFELYYPPFKSAIEAGVAAAMCAYNKVDGEWASANENLLKGHLKDKLGFQGFVMSDWGATHMTSIDQGLDMNQHMQDDIDPVFTPAEASEEGLNEAVTRILASMYHMDTFHNTICTPPECEGPFSRNVRSNEHTALSREAVTESVVLLKNEGQTLPLGPSVRTIAVIGPAAMADAYDTNEPGNQWNWGDYYSGGGSGHLFAGYVVKALEGITMRAQQAGIRVIPVSQDDPQGLAAAAEADVTFVVAGATSGETVDRSNLNLEGEADALISQVARVARKTVVLMQVCGSMLTPWRDEVDGIAVMFLGGPETGNAWGSVIFGDHAPTGHLPVMFPETEADTIEPHLEPNAQIDYVEGLATSYRNPAFRAAFPFGHGLTYTTFSYSNAIVGGSACGSHGADDFCVSVQIQNTGQTAAKTVAQLYLELPNEAGHPAPLLKGFQKTSVLQPGAHIEVGFLLGEDEMSYYEAGNWVRAGSGTAHIGASSADIRLSVTLDTSVSPVPIPSPVPVPVPVPSPPAPAGTCTEGQEVPCVGADHTCAGNQCCDGGWTCPSAHPDFSGCPRGKAMDCLSMWSPHLV